MSLHLSNAIITDNFMCFNMYFNSVAISLVCWKVRGISRER